MSSTYDIAVEEQRELEIVGLKEEVQNLNRWLNHSTKKSEIAESALKKSQAGYIRSETELKEALASNIKLVSEKKTLEEQLRAERDQSQLLLDERNKETNEAKKLLSSAEKTILDIQGPEGSHGKLVSRLLACQHALDISDQASKAKDVAIEGLNARLSIFTKEFEKLNRELMTVRNNMAQAPTPAAAPSAPESVQGNLAAELADVASEGEDESHPESPDTNEHPPISTPIAPLPLSLANDSTDDGTTATSPSNAADSATEQQPVTDGGHGVAGDIQQRLEKARNEGRDEVRREYESLFRMCEPPDGEPDLRNGRWEPMFDGNRKVMHEAAGGIPSHLSWMYDLPAGTELAPEVKKEWATKHYPLAGPYDAKQAVQMFPEERAKRLAAVDRIKYLETHGMNDLKEQLDKQTVQTNMISNELKLASEQNAQDYEALEAEAKEKSSRIQELRKRLAAATKEVKKVQAQLLQKTEENLKLDSEVKRSTGEDKKRSDATDAELVIKLDRMTKQCEDVTTRLKVVTEEKMKLQRKYADRSDTRLRDLVEQSGAWADQEDEVDATTQNAKKQIQAAEEKTAAKALDIDENKISKSRESNKLKKSRLKEITVKGGMIKKLQEQHMTTTLPEELPTVEGPTVSTAPSPDDPLQRLSTDRAAAAQEKQRAVPVSSERGTASCQRMHFWPWPFIVFLITLVTLFWYAGYSEAERRLWKEANDGARLATINQIQYGGRYSWEVLRFGNVPQTMYISPANNANIHDTTWVHPWIRFGSDTLWRILYGVGVVVRTSLGYC
ncbi:hypothetical protein B0J12DRAFT_161836 [Macrophomina phaseolina]|uniref:Uncharacterized protein n=1 Tax=Macrophomina phaseolina TaxID=35725 RepID=A0ABQ8GRV2_9PEZI|nr:hypothetical protein B0J12DRAFT_161836 [Macrophomina phaseolina]